MAWSGFPDNGSRGALDDRTSHDEALPTNKAGLSRYAVLFCRLETCVAERAGMANGISCRRPCTPQGRRMLLTLARRGTRNRCTHTQRRAQVSSGGSSLARGREARILQSVRWAYGTRTIFQYSSRTVRTFTYSFFLTQHITPCLRSKPPQLPNFPRSPHGPSFF